MELPRPYRDFLTNMGGSGASPYYGLIPVETVSDACARLNTPAGLPIGLQLLARPLAEPSCASPTPTNPTTRLPAP
ncbi:hypothetical protein [Kitasatospora sp. NPDC001132]